MSVIKIRLFGGVEVYHAGSLLPSFPTQRAQSLFAYLVLGRGRPFPRESLIGLFWGERPEAVARKSLRTELWRIRSVLEPEGVPQGSYIQTEGQQIRFHPALGAWTDAWEFEDRMNALEGLEGDELDREQLFELTRAVKLYRGSLLEGVYDDWCLGLQDRMKARYLGGLEALVRHYRTRADWTTSIALAHRILQIDPLREQVHRELMLCHYATGNRPLAILQYHECATILQRELDLEPMAETERLYDQIRSESLELPGKEGVSQPEGVYSSRIEGVFQDLFGQS